MSRYSEAQTRSNTHHVTPLTPDDGSEVQPMRVSIVVLAGQPRSCRPNLGGKVNQTSSPETRGCSALNNEAELMRSLPTSTSPSKPFHPWLTAARVNGERKARFTVSFTVHLEGDPKPYGIYSLRATRRWIRTRAKHRTGLERPPKSNRGRSSPAWQDAGNCVSRP
jgi:hypothetical protein